MDNTMDNTMDNKVLLKEIRVHLTTFEQLI